MQAQRAGIRGLVSNALPDFTVLHPVYATNDASCTPEWPIIPGRFHFRVLNSVIACLLPSA